MNGKLVVLAGGISSRMKKSLSSSVQIEKKLKEDAERKPKSMMGIGNHQRPFLDYLLFNAREVGYRDVIIVVGERDHSIQDHYGQKERGNIYHGLSIAYAVQKIPEGRSKPLGTGDALLCALRVREDWHGCSFSVCNSDNLYSQEALRLMLDSPHTNALIDYDRSSLKFEKSRIEKFAVTRKDKENYLVEIIEKPSEEEIESVRGKDDMIGVSMNLFRLDYDMILPYLETVPMHSGRQEKELPTAVIMMVKDHPKSCYAYPLKEHVPDLTQLSDVNFIRDYLDKTYKDFSF